MRTDSDVQYDVTSELSWRPDIDATDIAVKVREGVVTLTGFAGNYTQKHSAEAAAKRVSGVTGVANELWFAPQRSSPGRTRSSRVRLSGRFAHICRLWLSA